MDKSNANRMSREDRTVHVMEACEGSGDIAPLIRVNWVRGYVPDYKM